MDVPNRPTSTAGPLVHFGSKPVIQGATGDAS
jgi:hypothetical protein